MVYLGRDIVMYLSEKQISMILPSVFNVYQQGFSAVLLTMNIDFKIRILANLLSWIKRYTQPKYVNCQIPRFVCVSVIST